MQMRLVLKDQHMLEPSRVNLPSGQLSCRKEGPWLLQAALRALSSWFVPFLPVPAPIFTGLDRGARQVLLKYPGAVEGQKRQQTMQERKQKGDDKDGWDEAQEELSQAAF